MVIYAYMHSELASLIFVFQSDKYYLVCEIWHILTYDF